MHTAYTIDGGAIATHLYTHQDAGDFVANNLCQPQGPYVAYTHDDALGLAYPFTAWRNVDGVLAGQPCKDLDEVVAFVQGKRIVRTLVRFPTGLMNRHTHMRVCVDGKQFEITYLALSVEDANARMTAYPGEALIDTWLIGGHPAIYLIAKNDPV